MIIMSRLFNSTLRITDNMNNINAFAYDYVDKTGKND